MEVDPRFTEIMPYICNLSKIKDLLNELQSRTCDLKELQSALEEKLVSYKDDDPTLRTDLKIIIQFLDKKT